MNLGIMHEWWVHDLFQRAGYSVSLRLPNLFFMKEFRRLRLVLALTVFPLLCSAQMDNLGVNSKNWCDGTIVLADGTTLRGHVQYNDKLALIKFKEREDSEEESFAETSLRSMHFYDEEEESWRKFGAFRIYDEASGKHVALLFEVLIELESMALLSRIEPVKIATRLRYNPAIGYHQSRVGYEQYEKLCLVNEFGNAALILLVSELERYKLSSASKLKPYFNLKKLQEYLGDDWPEFENITKSNDLKLKKRDDFINAFEQYAQLIKSRG